MVKASSHVEAAAPPTRAAWVDTRLREAILGGELGPGERLRAEHLAAAWGVSATPLREAFQRLAGEGLVTIEPQRGARVTVVDAREAAELYEVRLQLDPLALQSAMKAGDDRYRAAVDDAYRGLSARHGSVAAFLRAHRAFHLATVSACTNRRLVQLVTELHDGTQRYHVAGGAHRHGDPRREHRALRDAVLAGEVRTAVTVLTAHLRATLAAVEAAAASPSAPPPQRASDPPHPPPHPGLRRRAPRRT